MPLVSRNAGTQDRAPGHRHGQGHHHNPPNWDATTTPLWPELGQCKHGIDTHTITTVHCHTVHEVHEQ